MVISDQWGLLSDPNGGLLSDPNCGADSFRLFFLLHGGACAIRGFPLKLALLISIFDLADFSPSVEIHAALVQLSFVQLSSWESTDNL